jgi:hypothetical protein
MALEKKVRAQQEMGEQSLARAIPVVAEAATSMAAPPAGTKLKRREDRKGRTLSVNATVRLVGEVVRPKCRELMGMEEVNATQLHELSLAMSLNPDGGGWPLLVNCVLSVVRSGEIPSTARLVQLLAEGSQFCASRYFVLLKGVVILAPWLLAPETRALSAALDAIELGPASPLGRLRDGVVAAFRADLRRIILYADLVPKPHIRWLQAEIAALFGKSDSWSLPPSMFGGNPGPANDDDDDEGVELIKTMAGKVKTKEDEGVGPAMAMVEKHCSARIDLKAQELKAGAETEAEEERKRKRAADRAAKKKKKATPTAAAAAATPVAAAAAAAGAAPAKPKAKRKAKSDGDE